MSAGGSWLWFLRPVNPGAAFASLLPVLLSLRSKLPQRPQRANLPRLRGLQGSLQHVEIERGRHGNSQDQYTPAIGLFLPLHFPLAILEEVY